MLYGATGDGTNSGPDIYKTAVIDTIVAEVQSVPGEDRCVLLLVNMFVLHIDALLTKYLFSQGYKWVVQ